MIQNILTFCVKNDLTFVEGSIPSGKLVANDINRNSIYLVTPYDEAIVKANFQTNLQSDKPTSVLGILVNGKITIDEIVPTSKSYYNLVKDWNIYEFKVPSTTLSFISRNRTGKIGINFSIEQRLVPTIKDSYGEYRGEIINGSFGAELGYYINKTIDFELDTGVDVFTYGLNDILILNSLDDIPNAQVKISAYSNRGSTPTAMYSVDPSLLNDNFETIEPSLTFQILQQVNDNTGDIVLLFQNVGINNDTLVDLENRISVAEQDIDKIENGTTIVGKALADSLGNVIKDSYVSAIYPVYNNTTDKLYIETYSVEDGLLANNEVILPKATTTKNGLMSATDKVKVDNIASDIASMGATKQSLSEKNQINGYAGLDANAKVPTVLLPDSILGQLEYKGTFNPASGYPSTPEKGWFYISIDNASISGVDYKIGDWAVYNGSSWDKVDNTDAVASVNGKLGVVVINGTEIQVGNGDTWTIEQRIVDIYAELNNRYTKTQTYSNTEIEQRLTDLLGMANLQDTAIEKSAGVFVFDNGDSLLASSLAQYNWVICRFYNVDGGVQNVRYNMFKPSEATSGNRTIVQIDRTPVRYAEIKRDNGNVLFRVVDESDTFDNAYVCTMKMWGIKLDGITANEVDYDNSTSGLVADKVQGAIDEVVVELNTLENKVDLVNTKQDIRINEIEELARKSASGETSDNVLGTDIIPLSKDTANAPVSVKVDGGILEAPNLVVNGDFSNGTTSFTPISAIRDSLSINNNKLRVTALSSDGNLGFRLTIDTLLANDEYYLSVTDFYTNSPNANSLQLIFNPLNTNPLFITNDKSMIFQLTYNSVNNPLFYVYNQVALWQINQYFEISSINIFNVSQMKIKGIKDDNGVLFSNLTNEQIRTQLDLWVSKGIIPNDNLLSVNMNKRVRSEVGGDTINELYQLVSNYDLTLDSNNDGIPDGFILTTSTANSLLDGIFTFTPNVISGSMQTLLPNVVGQDIYFYVNTQTASTKYTIRITGGQLKFIPPSNFSLTSAIFTPTNPTTYFQVIDEQSTSGFLPISLDYMGAINITQMKKDGWFVGMDNTQIKAFLDKVLQQGKANSDLYLQANVKGYSLPNGVKDTIEYKNGKYYFVKRVDDTDINNLVELSPYVETEIEAWGNLQGYESGIVYVDDIKIDASIYASGITTTSEIKTLDEIVKITNGVETQLDTSLAVIAVDKLSFTHPDLVDGDYVWFAYEEDGNYYKATTDITYYIDKLVRTSPDGSVWKLDWSVDNSGVITWTPTKI